MGQSAVPGWDAIISSTTAANAAGNLRFIEPARIDHSYTPSGSLAEARPGQNLWLKPAGEPNINALMVVMVAEGQVALLTDPLVAERNGTISTCPAYRIHDLLMESWMLVVEPQLGLEPFTPTDEDRSAGKGLTFSFTERPAIDVVIDLPGHDS